MQISKKDFLRIQSVVEKHTGLSLYKEQIKATKELLKGNIIEMKTGEGKSLVVLFAAALFGFLGRKCYVVSANDYLVKRDYDYGKKVFDELGLASVVLSEGVGGSEEIYKNNSIIYATGATLIFDYLRGIKADRDLALIDEVDFILVENSNHVYSVSDGTYDEVIDTGYFFLAKKFLDYFSYLQLEYNYKKADYKFIYQKYYDILIKPDKFSIEITEAGYDKVYSLLGDVPFEVFLNFIEILEATLQANLCYIAGVHYLVQDGKIIIINQSTGRVSPNGCLGVLLHTALEIKEGLEVTKKSYISNSCSYPVFFAVFNSIVGLSGTATDASEDFSSMFGKGVSNIPEHKTCQRKYHNIEVPSKAVMLYKIESIISKYKNSPILVVTDSDKEAFALKKGLRNRRNISILDNSVLERESDILSEFAKSNSILISNNIVGRGTDIDVDSNVEDGLIVILTKRFSSYRAEKQIIGRTARNGKVGHVFILTSKEDPIFLRGKGKVRKIQKFEEGKSLEQRKVTYICNKLFFDQEKAVYDRLSSFDSFDSMYSFVYKQQAYSEDTAKLLEASKIYLDNIKKKGLKFQSFHSGLLLYFYERIRLEYQQQFLRYGFLMSNQLISTDGFYDVSKVFRDMSLSVILTVLCILFEKIGGSSCQ